MDTHRTAGRYVTSATAGTRAAGTYTSTTPSVRMPSGTYTGRVPAAVGSYTMSVTPAAHVAPRRRRDVDASLAPSRSSASVGRRTAQPQ